MQSHLKMSSAKFWFGNFLQITNSCYSTLGHVAKIFFHPMFACIIPLLHNGLEALIMPIECTTLAVCGSYLSMHDCTYCVCSVLPGMVSYPQYLPPHQSESVDNEGWRLCLCYWIIHGLSAGLSWLTRRCWSVNMSPGSWGRGVWDRGWAWQWHVVNQEHCLVARTVCPLTHWGREKWPTFPRRHFQMYFLQRKCFNFRFKFHWNLFLRVQLTIFQHWFG